MTGNKDVQQFIERAAKFHGHLGPFLVIGVRMGEIAKRHLGVNEKNSRGLQASIRTRLATPFSCVIDGIQATTCCTVGNQRLKIEKSIGGITACFKLQSSDKTVKISVNPKVTRNLTDEMSKGADSERLAAKIAHLKEEQLFVLEE